MKIGHICLLAEDGTDCAWFANIVDAISRHDVEQHVLVANIRLAKKLAGYARVTVGPIVRSPVLAYCLMPNVDIAHVHDGDSGQAGLLLTLTRSIPFVLTADERMADDSNPLSRSVRNRAAHTVQGQPGESAEIVACRFMEIYRNTLSGRLEFPQNSDCRH